MWAADVSSRCKPPNRGTNSSNCWHLRTYRAARYGRPHSSRTLSLTSMACRRCSTRFKPTQERSWTALLFHEAFQPLLIQNISADSRLTGLCSEFYRRQGRTSKLVHCTILYSSVNLSILIVMCVPFWVLFHCVVLCIVCV